MQPIPHSSEMLYTGNQFVARDKLLAAVAGDAPPAVALVTSLASAMVSTGALVPLRNFVDPDLDYSQVKDSYSF